MLLGVFAVTAAESAVALGIVSGGAAVGIVRFAAATVIFCPTVALLGAKRPQDRAWQLIVLSFWVILALPAAQAWLVRAGQPLMVHPIWSWFLVVLVLVGATNYLPTRYAAAAILAAGGQAILVWPELPWGSLPSHNAADDWLPIVGLALLAAGAVAANIVKALRAPAKQEPLDRLWRDFRDQYGVVWGLRVAERINATATQNKWSARLTWHGLTQADGTPSESIPETEIENLKQTLLPLLRRFVSAEWIDRRLAYKPEA